MFQPMNIIKIAIVIAIGVLLQILLILADDNNTPDKAAMAFTKAYFALDQDTMNEYICSELTEDTDVVDQYVYRIKNEAENTGLPLYSKSMIYHVQAHVTAMEDSEAQVKISGKRRYSINPLYTLVAIVFQLGDVHHFDETIDLIREADGWKVCGSPFALTM